MKPLTIEELKALEVGDWVWLVDKAMGLSYYRQKNHHDTTHCLFERCINDMALNIFRWADYGKSWLAYKNKEMAEAKGEIIEFNYSLGDTVYFYDFTEKEIMQGKVIGLRLNYYTPSNPIWVRVQYDIPMIKKDCDTEVWANMVFMDKTEAERRLAELKEKDKK